MRHEYSIWGQGPAWAWNVLSSMLLASNPDSFRAYFRGYQSANRYWDAPAPDGLRYWRGRFEIDRGRPDGGGRPKPRWLVGTSRVHRASRRTGRRQSSRPPNIPTALPHSSRPLRPSEVWPSPAKSWPSCCRDIRLAHEDRLPGANDRQSKGDRIRVESSVSSGKRRLAWQATMLRRTTTRVVARTHPRDIGTRHA